MFYLTIVNKTRRHFHSWLAGEYQPIKADITTMSMDFGLLYAELISTLFIEMTQLLRIDILFNFILRFFFILFCCAVLLVCLLCFFLLQKCLHVVNSSQYKPYHYTNLSINVVQSKRTRGPGFIILQKAPLNRSSLKYVIFRVLL